MRSLADTPFEKPVTQVACATQLGAAARCGLSDPGETLGIGVPALRVLDLRTARTTFENTRTRLMQG